jgi:hypothetical protein
MRASDGTGPISAHVVRKIVWTALLCVLVCAVASACAQRVIGKDWYEDPRGPVFVSADGRTLLFAYGPAEVGDGANSCLSAITFDLSVRQNAASVAVRFHVHQVPDAQPAAGVCAIPVGFPQTLDRPLGARTLTDSHGRPLAVLDGQRVPQLRDPQVTEPRGPVPCVVLPRSGLPGPCLGTFTLRHEYSGPGQAWTFYQRPATGPGAVPPQPGNTPSSLRAGADGAPAVCDAPWPNQWTLRWQQNGCALTLAFGLDGETAPFPPGAATPCALLARESGFVR